MIPKAFRLTSGIAVHADRIGFRTVCHVYLNVYPASVLFVTPHRIYLAKSARTNRAGGMKPKVSLIGRVPSILRFYHHYVQLRDGQLTLRSMAWLWFI